MTNSERPGVYTSYEVSSSVYGSGKGSAVGIAAAAEGGEAGEIVTLSSRTEAVEAFGGGNMVKLTELLLKNGAPTVYAVRAVDGDYATAFAALMTQGDIRFMACDSHEAEVHSAMKEAILSGDEQGKYRAGIVECAETTRAALVEKAQALNSERMVLVSHQETDGTPGAVAAAVCGIAAGGTDPALPLNGAEMLGLGDVGANFSDGDVTLLITGGVTPIETIFGSKTIIRGITTKTTSGGAADITWREMNTIMILDHMIPAIRDGLRAKFARAKNTAQTRGAIRTYVLVALEDYLNREIIDSYGDITAAPSAADPTVCMVEFAFTVAHGLNKIELRAHITV